MHLFPAVYCFAFDANVGTSNYIFLMKHGHEKSVNAYNIYLNCSAPTFDSSHSVTLVNAISLCLLKTLSLLLSSENEFSSFSLGPVSMAPEGNVLKRAFRSWIFVKSLLNFSGAKHWQYSGI